MRKDFSKGSCWKLRMLITLLFPMILLIGARTQSAKAGGPHYIGGSSYFDWSTFPGKQLSIENTGRVHGACALWMPMANLPSARHDSYLRASQSGFDENIVSGVRSHHCFRPGYAGWNSKHQAGGSFDRRIFGPYRCHHLWRRSGRFDHPAIGLQSDDARRRRSTANPIRVRVVAADGITPVSGASVNLSANPAAALTACGVAPGCTVSSNENDEASTRVTPLSPGASVITAALAPASYNPAKYVQAAVNAQSSPLDIAVLSPYRWVAEKATLNLPLVAEVLANGAPQSGKRGTFRVTMGNATVSPGSASTDSNGYASTTVQIHKLAGQVQVSACVSPAGAPCAILTVTKVALANLKLQRVAGSKQMVGVGQPFQPLILQATDSSSPANPVQGAAANFWAGSLSLRQRCFQRRKRRGRIQLLQLPHAGYHFVVSEFGYLRCSWLDQPGSLSWNYCRHDRDRNHGNRRYQRRAAV
jgi:hypothetical protein